MPWKASDAKRHTKKAKGKKQQGKWAKIANAVLKKNGDEGMAIRVANAKVKEN